MTDPTNGLVLMTHRYYDPETGRFLKRDPIGTAGGVNLYGYTSNNSVNYVDPLELDAITPPRQVLHPNPRARMVCIPSPRYGPIAWTRFAFYCA